MAELGFGGGREFVDSQGFMLVSFPGMGQRKLCTTEFWNLTRNLWRQNLILKHLNNNFRQKYLNAKIILC